MSPIITESPVRSIASAPQSESDSRSGYIVVLGSSNTDMVVPVPHIPSAGETVLGSDLIIAAGGKGANQAVAAARLGGTVYFLGAVGDDDLGTRAASGLSEEGIDTSHLKVVPGVASGVAVITVDPGGNNAIAVAPGANSHVSANDVRDAGAAIEAAGVLLVQLETPMHAVRAGLKLAREAGCRTILNPAPAPSGGLGDALLNLVDVLTPNEGEAASLAGQDAPPEALAGQLLGRGVGAVVITLGERGVWVATPQRHELVPAHSVKAVDTTAAGDAFSGAFAVALAEGADLFEAARFAAAAAALSVTKRGAQPSMPRRDEVDALLQDEPNRS